MSNQSWESLLNDPAPTSAGTALASSTSTTEISPATTTSPRLTIPANYLQPGQVLRVFGAGTFSTTGAPNLTLSVYYGTTAGVLLCGTGTVATTSGASNEAWLFNATITVRGIGTAGTAASFGWATGITSATAPAVNIATQAGAPTGAFATATIDTTAAKDLILAGTWGTNSASNTITCQMWTVEGLN